MSPNRPGVPTCYLCGLPVRLSDPTTYHEVAGWVRRRSGGGVHALALRRELHRYSHGPCLDAARRGTLRFEQLDMFDQPGGGA